MVATYHMRLVIMRQLLACPEIPEVKSRSLSGTALMFDDLRHALPHQYEVIIKNALSLGRKNSPYFIPPASGYVHKGIYSFFFGF